MISPDILTNPLEAFVLNNSNSNNSETDGPRTVVGERIMFLAGWLGHGGASAYLDIKARWLTHAGAEVVVVSGGGPRGARLDDSGIMHIVVEALARPAVTASQHGREQVRRQLYSIVQRHRPRLIEAAWPSSAEYGELFRKEAARWAPVVKATGFGK